MSSTSSDPYPDDTDDNTIASSVPPKPKRKKYYQTYKKKKWVAQFFATSSLYAQEFIKFVWLYYS